MDPNRLRHLRLKSIHFYGFFVTSFIAWSILAWDSWFNQSVKHHPEAWWAVGYLVMALCALGALILRKSAIMRQTAIVVIPAFFIIRILQVILWPYGYNSFDLSQQWSWGGFALAVWISFSLIWIIPTLWVAPPSVGDYLDLKVDILSAKEDVELIHRALEELRKRSVITEFAKKSGVLEGDAEQVRITDFVHDLKDPEE